MGVLSRIRKVFGPTEPASVKAGEVTAGMTPSRPFSPGEPIGPYDGFSRAPRSHEFVTGYNISARPRSHERVAFDTLRGLVEAYDVAQMCIWHRIDSVRSLDWTLIAAKGVTGDVTDAIPLGMAALAKPDRQMPFANWLASWLYDILAYDAGTLYRLRNRAGRAIGLRVVDGTSIAPLVDYWGNSPEPPAEAYVQYVQGLPWNWLTRHDLIYEPFRKRPNTPYGTAPLESILLNANTDLRFQAYFLQRFTEGNIPEAFASAPETWTPQQIEEFQTYWDGFMLGDQAYKHQIRWMPGGSSIAWSNEKEFQDHFSLFLMRKTAAAYHVVPADLGFTENVNRSSGESQADVQHRVGDLPLLRHVQSVLSTFLQEDLGLPLAFAFDLGEEQADRLQQAQADKIYVDLGAISASDVRELRYGLPEPDGVPVPRFVFTNRSGPIPLSSLYAVAGTIDQATAAPEPGAPLPHTVFAGAEGAEPNPPIKGVPLAEQIYGPAALPPAPPKQVTKDAPATSGISAATGITSYDLNRDDEDEEQRAELVKRELASFRRFRAARRRERRWRDFTFTHVAPVTGHRLNDAGRLAIRKDTGQVAVAGLAVLAEDTGRVLMLQRALDDEDPAAGMWEIPGGHVETGETPLRGAWREWSEEVGCVPPPGRQTGSWASADGVYQGIVWTVDSEDCVPLDQRDQITNPDDPDGDQIEAIAWWDPAQLPGNPAVRTELLDSIDAVLGALGQPVDDAEVAKASGAAPKDPSSRQWPGWDRDLAVQQHWAPILTQALTGAVPADTLAAAWLNNPTASGDRDAARRWLDEQHLTIGDALSGPLRGVWTDGYLVGSLSSAAVLTAHRQVEKAAGLTGTVDWGSWTPGDSEAARLVLGADGSGSGLAELLAASDTTIKGIEDTKLDQLARILADGLAAGDAPTRIARNIRDLVDNRSWANRVALTETTRASTAATLNRYTANGVDAKSWATAHDSRVCQICIENEEASPIPLGATFPDGSDGPPSHPDDRCCLYPEFVSVGELSDADLSALGTLGGEEEAASLADEVGIDETAVEEEAAEAEATTVEEEPAETPPEPAPEPEPEVVEEPPAPQPVVPEPPTLAERVQAGISSERMLGGGASARTDLVTFTDGSQAVRKVVGLRGERDAVDAQDAEELAALVARQVGVTTPAVFRAGEDLLYMEYVGDAEVAMERYGSVTLDNPDVAAMADSEQGRKLGLFDVLIGNLDRNSGNWLIGPDGTLTGIDHGFAFEQAKPETLLPLITRPGNVFANRLLDLTGDTAGGTRAYSKADITYLRNALKQIRPEFKRMGRLGWYNDAVGRLKLLDGYAAGEGALFQ